MSENTNERLEHEARESLVASDLSAKMKQWREQTPPQPGGNGRFPWLFIVLLLAIGAAVWWFWPTAEDKTMSDPAPPAVQPAPAGDQPTPSLPQKSLQEPVVQKSARNRYLALAQSNYYAPDFAADTRGDTPISQDALNMARQALARKHPADALVALSKVPPAYLTDADYLRGHALFAQKKYTQAATVFEKLTGSVRYGEAAQWYETLALLPDFDRNKSLIMNRLNTIAGDEDHVFQREAKRLLGEL